MRLIDYLKTQNETVGDFANRIDEAENTVRKIVYGQRQPSLPLALKISDATGGRTSPAELAFATPAQSDAAGEAA